MSSSLLVTVGSANIDLVFSASKFPLPGETLIGHGFQQFAGGKGANQAVAAAMLGANVQFVGKIGDDAFGEMTTRNFKESGVGVERLLVSAQTPTGTAGIVVADSGENSIVVNSGANAELSAEEVSMALRELKPAMVATQFEVSHEVFEACLGSDRTLVNPAPARGIPAACYPKIEILTPNRLEALALSGIEPVDEESCAACARFFLNAGVKAVVITLGSKGSFMATNNERKLIAAPTVKPVDTTGAGDTFTGALATFLLEGRDLENSVSLANAAAAISTTRPGAQAKVTRAELRSLVPSLL
jgi:ribokinase